MAVSGEESFDAYTSEWTKAISRGGIFEVNNATYIFSTNGCSDEIFCPSIWLLNLNLEKMRLCK